MKRHAAILATLLLFPVGAICEAQIPRARPGFEQNFKKSNNPRHIKEYLAAASFFRVVTVDSGGAGDFADLSDALAHVAAQTPTAASRWTVLVYPGSTDAQQYSYSEASLTIPAFTTLQGMSGSDTHGIVPAGMAACKLTGTAGPGVTLGNQSSIVNFGFRTDAIVEAGYKMFSFPSGVSSVALRNIYAFMSSTVPDVQADIFSFTGGSAQMAQVSVHRSGTATNTRHLYASSGGASVYGGRLIPGTSQAKLVETAGATVRFFSTRVDSGSTVEFTNTSGTLSIDSVSYRTETGVITRAGALTPRITYGDTAPATCAAPEIFVDVDSSTLCACTAANTWKCAAIS